MQQPSLHSPSKPPTFNNLHSRQQRRTKPPLHMPNLQSHSTSLFAPPSTTGRPPMSHTASPPRHNAPQSEHHSFGEQRPRQPRTSSPPRRRTQQKQTDAPSHQLPRALSDVHAPTVVPPSSIAQPTHPQTTLQGVYVYAPTSPKHQGCNPWRKIKALWRKIWPTPPQPTTFANPPPLAKSPASIPNQPQPSSSTLTEQPPPWGARRKSPIESFLDFTGLQKLFQPRGL